MFSKNFTQTPTDTNLIVGSAEEESKMNSSKKKTEIGSVPTSEKDDYIAQVSTTQGLNSSVQNPDDSALFRLPKSSNFSCKK